MTEEPMTEEPDDAPPKPFHLQVKRDDSLTGSIDTLDSEGYVVIVADGVLAIAWSGTRDTVTEAVALMGQIFRDKLMVT